ncbi:MerC domain-containing protein [Marinifilum caeruleilacunae]|uniref:MerC domain-containing protein n=1 Tax=Marinifilum caeruleilacunae TaxID=2499076 RepID=A0ABX1WV65_9BACT|nr:MerC domain-containing protein [Marinifilum caeruleilacunae]NOU59916.1 MerC domain-containing protein [Marinifilum caeruleilacunae]
MASTTLCLVHCILTPFIFIAQACAASCCAESPVWWRVIDFLFLVISFIAVYFAAKNSSKRWVKIALYVLFAFLSFFIINEHAGSLQLNRIFLYTPAFLLFALHLYNKKYCQCQDECYTV